MFKRSLSWIVGLVAASAFFVPSSPAAALTVSPTGAYSVGSTGSLVFRFSSTGQALTCTSSVIRATVSSNGRGTIPAGSVTFAGCTNALLGTFTVTQTSAWTIEVVLSPLADGINTLVGLRVTIPARGVRISSAACTSFTLNGTTLKGRLYPLPLPVRVNTTDVFSFLSTLLTVDSVTGCSPLIAIVGLTATFNGNYILSRAATVSG